jgi:hypothetical protein
MYHSIFTLPRRKFTRRSICLNYRPALEQLETRQLLSNVLTYHDDNTRTGQNLTETILTPANVAPNSFGKLFSYSVDGQVYAQPLYVAGVPMSDGPHNVVFIATEHDSVYAFDANDPTAGSQGNGILWQVSFIDPAHGIDTFNQNDALGCGQITPEIGITATPAIDINAGVMYVVDQFKDTSSGSPVYHHQLHALDITSGSDVVSPVEIEASVVNDSGQTVTFNPREYKERAGLTLSNGVLYTAWASHCDAGNAHGWVIGYDATSLQQLSVFNTSPNGRLDTIWQGDGSLAVDATGALYFETGNGTDILQHGDDYSEAFIRLNGGDGQTVDDYFIPANFHELDQADRDLGSGAPIVLPDQPGDHPHLLVGAGKEGKIYLIDRDNMGGLFNPPNGPDQVVQELPNAISGGSWDTPAYFDGGDPNGPWIYYVGNGDAVKAWQLQNGLLTTNPTSQSSNRFSGSYGATPIVSANGTQNGIVWALQDQNPAVLYAYDATDLTKKLYDTTMVSTDRLGPGIKFNSPIVADGEVFVAGANSVTVLGLLGNGPVSHGRGGALGNAVTRALAITGESGNSLSSAVQAQGLASESGAHRDMATNVAALAQQSNVSERTLSQTGQDLIVTDQPSVDRTAANVGDLNTGEVDGFLSL